MTTTLYELYLWCRVLTAGDEAYRGCQLEIFMMGCRRKSSAPSGLFPLLGGLWSVLGYELYYEGGGAGGAARMIAAGRDGRPNPWLRPLVKEWVESG